MNKEELIEKYFSNRFSDSEFSQIQELLENDSEFKAKFYSQLEVQQTIASEKHAPLKERLKKLDQNPKKSKSRYLYAAAVLVVLFGIGVLFYDPPTDYNQLYVQNFEPYPNVITLTNRSEATTDNFSKAAFEHYDTGNFAAAAADFETLFKNHPQDFYLFYQGMSLLANGDTEKGVDVMENYSWEENKSDFATVANWYLGLAYLKIERETIAKKHLLKVSNSESNLNKSAKEILKTLD